METGLIDIIIFAGIAGTLIWRLRGVLGRRPDQDEKDEQAQSHRKAIERKSSKGKSSKGKSSKGQASKGKSSKGQASPGEEPDDLLEQEDLIIEVDRNEEAYQRIRHFDREFDADEFMDGARKAFSMIVQAFGAGDMSGVRFLLSESVASAFEEAIKSRTDKGNAVRKVLDIDTAEIEDATVAPDGQATLVVQFTSQQTVQGPDDEEPTERRVNDQWTFSRDLTSSTPAWLLIKTSAS